MGMLLFTCAGRGPDASFLGETMSDARTIDRNFPGLPVVGLYAGGEIAPEARAQITGSVLTKRQAKLQGFTAALGCFCLPNRADAMRAMYEATR